MAGRTLFRSWLVEQNRFRIDHPGGLVTAGAPDILVRATQRELSALLMIEQRGLPLGAVVTFSAACDVRLRELLAMHVLMAILALCGSSFEIDIQQLGLKIRRLVAIDTGRSAVCA